MKFVFPPSDGEKKAKEKIVKQNVFMHSACHPYFHVFTTPIPES
jgi:hypothetical protein